MANNKSPDVATDFDERYPDASARSTEAAMNLVLTADLIVKHISDLLRPFDLSPAGGLVLSALADSDSPLSPHKIAERLIISRASVTGLLDSLERRGYVQRTPHGSDRRMLLIELTEMGRKVARDFRPIIHRREKVWLGALSEKEQRQLIDLLHRIQATVAASEKGA
jgi:DNA-binding MarR family transcriptional regulator